MVKSKLYRPRSAGIDVGLRQGWGDDIAKANEEGREDEVRREEVE
eukprot:SAG31_NODE_2385_length_5819_cov_3.572902_6_plen_45_part_00